MADLGQQELAGVLLHDERRVARLIRLVDDLADCPQGGIPTVCDGDTAAVTAAYRLLNSPSVPPAAVLAAHAQTTVARMRSHRTVIVAQDTTELDYRTHHAMAGRGRLQHDAPEGLLVQTALAVAENGVPLGILHQHLWARPVGTGSIADTRRDRPTAEKESQRWLDTVTAVAGLAPAETHVVVTGDRESDIYDLFALSRPAHVDLLARVAHNRAIVEDEQYLHAAAAAVVPQRWKVVPVAARRGHPARTALVQIGWRTVTLRPPRHHLDRSACVPVELSLVVATEVDPPADVTPLSWLLLTTAPVDTGDDAVRVVMWYRLRWQIEQYHDVLKEGCRIERSRLQSTDAVELLLACYTVVSWWILYTRYLAEQDPAQSCSIVFATEEWQVLYRQRYPRKPLPLTPPALGEAIRWLGHLGGFLGRTRDGSPGIRAVWVGIARLADLTAGWRLARGLPHMG